MNRLMVLGMGLAVAGFWSSIAMADLGPRPGPRPPRPSDRPAPEIKLPSGAIAPLEIKVDAKAELPQIVIPRKYIAAQGKPTDGKHSSNESKLPTIIAGIALALSVACVPFLTKWRRGTRIAAATLIGVLGVTAAVGMAFADIPPGPSPRRPPIGKPEVTPTKKPDQVVISITEDGDKVVLTLPAPWSDRPVDLGTAPGK